MLDEATDVISSVGPDIIIQKTVELIEVWPEALQIVRHSWLANQAREGESIRQQLRTAFQSHRQDLVQIQDRFRQLQEYHSRYHSIMTRSGLWDFALGVAIGAFTGGLGLVGAQVWDNWRGQSDAAFVKSFGGAIDDFCNTTLSFTQKTEQAVEVVMTRFLSDFHDFVQNTVSALETVANTRDITPIYNKLHFPGPEENLDENGRQVVELVLSNLRDQKISSRSETNLRGMLGLLPGT